MHQSLIASLIVDSQTGEIYAAEFNTVCRLTNDFITSLIVGRNLRTDVDELIQAIQVRYMGGFQARYCDHFEGCAKSAV